MWLLDLIVPLVVITFNTILKALVKFLIAWVGFSNRTLELSKIQNTIFILLFFNTGVSILIINTNLQREGFWSSFDGMYSDFSDGWHRNIAFLFILPMLVQITFPFSAFAPALIMSKLTAWLD